MNKKKIFLSIFFMFFLVFMSNTSFGATIEDTYLDDEGNITYTYKVHDKDSIYEGSFVISSEFRETLSNFAIFVVDGSVYLFNSEYVNLYFYNNGSYYNYFYFSNSVNTIFEPMSSYYIYSTSSEEFVLYSGDYIYRQFSKTYFNPNHFLFSSGLNVYRSYSKPTSTNYTEAKLVQACAFNVSDPYFISYENNVFTFALNAMYPDYSYSSDDGDGLNDISIKTLDDFYLSLCSSIDSSKSLLLTSTTLSDSIIDSDIEGVGGKILRIDLSTLFELNGLDITEGETILYEFCFAGTYKCVVSFSSGSISTYYTYYSSFVEGSFDYCVNSSSTTTPDDSDSDDNTQNNTVTNTIVESNKEVTNSINEQTNAIKEQTETNKSIWETIKEILSYLNPFSENFFAYKLIGLLLEGLKSLFVPSDGFFDTFFDELKTWFEEKLGFLFYPFDLIIDVLNRILNIDFSEPVIEIPDINEPFTGEKLISATSFNFNSLLDNSVLKNVHDIYLVVVDAIIVFCLVNLAKRKFEEVTTK